MTVRKAVIPAAGLGTRFLPATKALAKEMIPVVDRPGIQYAVEEAARAGIDDVLFVTSWGKGSLEDHFDRALDLERRLEASGKSDELGEIRRIASLAEIHSVRQKEPLGFGHAVLMGRRHVGDEPFVVLVPDEIVPEPQGDEPHLLQRMIEIHEERSASVIAVQEIPREEVASYGVIDPEPIGHDVALVKDMVEKPSVQDAPSNLASPGRYLFTAEIFDALDRTNEGHGGEIQLTDAIRLLAAETDVYAYIHKGPIYDVGKKLDYLRATVELTLRRDDLSKPFRDFLSDRLKQEG